MEPYDCLLVLKEKKGRIQSYQGFSKKDMLKHRSKGNEQKTTPSKAHKKKKIPQTFIIERTSDMIEYEHTPRKDERPIAEEQLQLFKSGQIGSDNKKEKFLKLSKPKNKEEGRGKHKKTSSMNICPKAIRRAQQQMQIEQENVHKSSRPVLK